MTIEDEMVAERALFHYLTEWGVDDAGTRSKKFIAELVTRGWRMDPRFEARPQPPRADDACHLCGRHLDRCICPKAQTRPPERVPATSAWRDARAALAAARVDTEEQA